MSGPERVTAGETSHDDPSSRFKAVKNPTSSPSKVSPSQELSNYKLPRPALSQLSESRAAYTSWISSLEESLSPKGRAIVRTAVFDQLKEVPHSTVAHSRVMYHVDLTRWEHCIHAAHTVRALAQTGKLGLSEKEVQVMELVMLLHDPHRLGSHALDRVFASMPGAPKDFNSWWPADDYHEYHGACLLAKDAEMRQALGGHYDDVISILTREDRRDPRLKEADYGKVRPTLSEERLAALLRLKDEIDRCSYLKLDYIRSGFKLPIIASAIQDVERHERTLAAQGAGIQLHIDEHTGPEPYNDVARLRYRYREKLATLAVGCLAERVIFHDGVWDKARAEHGGQYLESRAFYEKVRDCALRGDYAAIFSKEALGLIHAARIGKGLGVEDVYAPLVTMTLADMTDMMGVAALEQTLPPGLSQSICGVPRKDMTLFEAGIREALTKAGLDSNVHVLTSNDFGKTFEYDVSRGGEAPERKVTHHDCHDSLIKVIVAARAIDENGETRDLSRAKYVVEQFLRSSGYLKDPRVFESFNPRIFCDPVDPSIFSDKIRQKFSSMKPEWMRRGGCGIVPDA